MSYTYKKLLLDEVVKKYGDRTSEQNLADVKIKDQLSFKLGNVVYTGTCIGKRRGQLQKLIVLCSYGQYEIKMNVFAKMITELTIVRRPEKRAKRAKLYTLIKNH